MKLNLYMRLLLVATLFVGFFNCSSTFPKDESVQTQQQRINSNNNASYCPSIEEQDELVREFAYVCEEYLFVEYLFQEGGSRYSLYTFKDTFEPDGFEDMLDVDSLTNYQYSYLTELIHTYCTNNYLHFNIVIPYPYCVMNSIADSNVYIVNALYRQALGDAASLGGMYKVSYINSNPINEMDIDESFCQTHKVIVLTFRDCITGWKHFAKGEQSISDWLIKTSVSYQGYGSTSYDDLYNFSISSTSLTIPILHSKKTLRKPCDERYDHFCKFGKPENQLFYADNPLRFYETLDYMDADPNLTSWSELVEGETIQYIPIMDNSLGLDLYGHDFFITDTTFALGDWQSIYIPAQICEYDEDMNAQRFVVEWR